MKKYLFGLVPLVALSVAGCTTDPAANMNVSANGSSAAFPFTMVSNRYGASVKIDGVYNDASGQIDPNGGVVLQITITNNSSSYYGYSVSDFGLEDPNGNIETFSLSVESNLYNSIQGPTNLAPGGHVTGYIGFNWPSDAKNVGQLKLTWLPAEVGTNYKVVSLQGAPQLKIASWQINNP